MDRRGFSGGDLAKTDIKKGPFWTLEKWSLWKIPTSLTSGEKKSVSTKINFEQKCSEACSCHAKLIWQEDPAFWPFGNFIFWKILPAHVHQSGGHLWITSEEKIRSADTWKICSRYGCLLAVNSKIGSLRKKHRWLGFVYKFGDGFYQRYHGNKSPIFSAPPFIFDSHHLGVKPSFEGSPCSFRIFVGNPTSEIFP